MADSGVAVFAKDVGVWDVEAVVQPGPGAPATQHAAVSTQRLLAQRWLIVDYASDSGFEGHGVYGYDEARRVYVGTWVDSLQTAIARSEGTWDAATRTMTFVTMAGHQGQMVRYSEITQTLESGIHLYRNVITLPDGAEFEMIRSTYRRRPG